MSLVDIGEYSVLMIDELQPLPWTFWKLPLQAINARLSGKYLLHGVGGRDCGEGFVVLGRQGEYSVLIIDELQPLLTFWKLPPLQAINARLSDK